MTAWQNRIEAQENASPSSAKHGRAAERQRLVDAVVEAAKIWRSGTQRGSMDAMTGGRLIADAVDALNAFDARHDETPLT